MFVHDVVYRQAAARVEQYRQEAARDHLVAASRPSFRARFAAGLHRLAERLEPAPKLATPLNVR